MATTHTLVSLIMCDDCRREDNGKEIIIGVYTGAIITPDIPVMLPTFALRFEIIPKQNEYKKTIAIIKDPNGEEIVRVEGSLAIARIDLGASFFYRVSPLPIMTAGTYKIYLGLDEEPEEIASLQVLKQQLAAFSPPTS
jgi:hypothetical protein